MNTKSSIQRAVKLRVKILVLVFMSEMNIYITLKMPTFLFLLCFKMCNNRPFPNVSAKAGLTNQIFIYLSSKKGLFEKPKYVDFSLYSLYIFLGKPEIILLAQQNFDLSWAAGKWICLFLQGQRCNFFLSRFA